MNLDPCNSQLCLSDNRPLRLRSARGVRVTCTAGVAWLTVAGEAGDILLTAGESHRVRSNGLALLEAIGTARVRLEPPARRWPTLWWHVPGRWRHRSLTLLALDWRPLLGWRGRSVNAGGA
ncbi:MAG: hypothetical protein FAZ92_00632 [Accumulibacter sp.]|jgi:hypothetical protein|uniref:DUF2917 domain-containing protein n=1 Tax=Accumulibacter sp. TaxID=2053492 RepID=UPI001222EA53|nr:DUF2917 domain-containing protein [Accumulibacter sp.]QKS29476.1 MAG: DUF2917 domain-containing protein [Candidatus Accumulibacter similis]TLD47057.1 MAG: hypothetical protein FAZ92_00632 [Accumulibacter sp.]